MRDQKSSSSPGVRRGFEGGQMPLYRRIPKLRGISGGCHYKVLPLVQRITESHHRKCLVCAASFGPNDVKSVCISDWKLGNVCFCCSYMIPSSRTFDLVVLIYDTIFKDTIYKNRRSVEILLGPGSTTLENTQEKFLDVKRLSLQVRESLEELQSKVDKSRLALMGVLIELEKERFDKKRMEEELDIARRKVLRLQAQKEGSSVVDELRQELREYREIV